MLSSAAFRERTSGRAGSGPVLGFASHQLRIGGVNKLPMIDFRTLYTERKLRRFFSRDCGIRMTGEGIRVTGEGLGMTGRFQNKADIDAYTAIDYGGAEKQGE